MSHLDEEHELVAYVEGLLASQLAARREAEDSSEDLAPTPELEVTETTAPDGEDVSGPSCEGRAPIASPVEEPALELSPEGSPQPLPQAPPGTQSASPSASLREVFSALPLGGSLGAGLKGSTPQAATGRPPSAGRLGDGLSMLFGPAAVGTHAAATRAAATPADPPHAAATPADPPQAAPAITGVAELDRCLGAGFPPGLWFVTADVPDDARAFIEAAVWEAATRQRPVLYLALTGGVDAVRGRFRAMLGNALGDDLELDSILLRTVLRHVRFVDPRELVDSVIAGSDPMGVFLRDLDVAIGESTAKGGAAPVVAIDDLGALLRLLGAPSKAQSARALGGMDAVLRSRRAPGLITAAGPDAAPARAGSGLVELHRRGLPRMHYETVPMDARVIDYSWEGRSETVGLVYHRSAGMFAAAG